MPEVVEVEIQKEGLEETLIGDMIKNVTFHDKGEKIVRPISREDFTKKVTNKEITAVGRKGKYLIIELDKDLLLTSHLAMTGRWLLDVSEEEIGHTRLEFELFSGRTLRYSDVRVFGRIRIEKDLKNKIYNKGIDVFKASEEEVKKCIEQTISKKPTLNVKKFLTDQKAVSGLGNVYANEVLWEMGLNPSTNLGQLDSEQISLLAFTIKDIINFGYTNGGLSLKDYYHVDGTKGHAQDFLEVYKKETCSTCGTQISKSDEFDGRATYYCSKCQIK